MQLYAAVNKKKLEAKDMSLWFCYELSSDS